MFTIATLCIVYAQVLLPWLKKRAEDRDQIVWDACLYPGGRQDR